MNTIILILSAIAVVAAAWAAICDLRRDLMMLQQNSYRRERYMRWLRTSEDSTSWLRVSSYAVLFFSVGRFTSPIVGMSLVVVWSIYAATKRMKAKYKKPLVMTDRAKRIFAVSILLCLAVVAFSIGVSYDDLTRILQASATGLMACFCFSHIIIILANIILEPVQKAINRRYYNDARRRLEGMRDLTVVAVTGSYGKTSTKHYLNEILSEHFDTVMTPGSFNTTLGVVRTIREYLKPYNNVFIVEMGAKQKGDIEEICQLVKPSIGIVTAVGPQHLETFHTIECVRDTKFELVDALPSDGLAVLNDDFPMIASRQVTNVPAVRYSLDTEDVNARFVATDIQYSPMGTTFNVVDRQDGSTLALSTSLVGGCNISNLVAAVIVALHLGVPREKIRYAVGRIGQVEHRLQITRTGYGYTVIDDAYNSNPVGSAMALEVLAQFTSGTRYIITPGMIELGEDQYRLNKEFGAKIPAAADVAIIVGEYNKEAILEGIHEADPDGDKCRVVEAPTFLKAHAAFMQTMKPGDTVLYENDLPDTFK